MFTGQEHSHKFVRLRRQSCVKAWPLFVKDIDNSSDANHLHCTWDKIKEKLGEKRSGFWSRNGSYVNTQGAWMFPRKHRDLREDLAISWKMDQLNSTLVDGSYSDHTQQEWNGSKQSIWYINGIETISVSSKLFCLKKTDLSWKPALC